MEIHRLKPMKEGYDEKLFNQLYKETEPLRRLLTYQIDSRRYGVTPDIIKSWFDDKFIFVFNKYYGDITEGQLKGRIINALKTFKFRMLRKAYSKNNIYLNEVRLDGEHGLINIIPLEEEITNHQLFLELALSYLKKNLCDDAFLVLEIELNPPHFILDKLNTSKTKIPAKLIAEYLDLESTRDSSLYINDLRSEVQYWVQEAKNNFTECKSATPLM
jgi:hypothetical protein